MSAEPRPQSDRPTTPTPLPGERPQPGDGTISAGWASDLIAELLRELDVHFVALNPGSSYRGLHDSLVNHLGNHDPQLLLCLHEEHAVALAHGYAKVTDRPMAVALHSNVGLMHASMAIFNAYCDRVPMLILGATGPLDAAQRRPWIDWLHTAVDQAALVRPFVKWDDQPLSCEAALDAVLHAHRTTCSAPAAPVYVCLDAGMQEARLEGDLARPDVARFAPAAPAAPTDQQLRTLAERLHAAQRVVLLAGRASRGTDAWERRVQLAERLGAEVFTHLKLPAAFPTTHPLHRHHPQAFTSPALVEALQHADVVLSLDWLDLGGTLASAAPVPGHVVSVTRDDQLHSGWGKESMSPAPVDVHLPADVDATVTGLLRHLPTGAPPAALAAPTPAAAASPTPRPPDTLVVADVARELRSALGSTPTSLVRVPNSWSGDLWSAEHPLDILGADGGEGIGSGPGMTIGAALALRDSGRLAVSILGDGDVAMGANALWTAAHYRLALLIIVANNSSFFNDEIHQHRVAVQRDRPTENRWIGQHMIDPQIDLAAIARAQGLTAHGPVSDLDDLAATLRRAVAEVHDGQAVLVDVRVSSSIEGEPARAVSHGDRR